VIETILVKVPVIKLLGDYKTFDTKFYFLLHHVK